MKIILETYLNQSLIMEKKVLIFFFIQNDKNLLKEIGFSKNDINLLNLEFKNKLIEQQEAYLNYIKNAEESIIE